MVIQNWVPFRDFRHIERAIARGANGNGHTHMGTTDNWAVPLDVIEDDANITVKATIPGVAPDDVSVTLEDKVLTIEGEATHASEEKSDTYLLRERRSGKFRRAVRMPDRVDFDNAETAYENGVLSVTFPKIEALKPRKLEIKAE